MSIALAVLLGIVQGLTEFLPVSSSGHLVVSRRLLAPWFGTVESPLAFDVLVHAATGLVTAFFLRRELFDILRSLFGRDEAGKKVRRLAAAVVLATLPAVIVGFTAKDLIEESFNSFETALNGFLVTALLLEWGHRQQVRAGMVAEGGIASFDWPMPTLSQAFLIGIAQSCAVVPGISRSGATIAAALILGLGPVSAVRFSFYMLLPVVCGAVVLELPELQGFSAGGGALLAGFAVTAAVAYAAMHFLVWLVRGAKLRYFAIYTLALSLLLRLI